jgi:sec-independent protein translocase protein TatB
MLDIGSWEFLLVIMLGIVVIGPKELPGVIRSVGLWVRRAKDLAREFQGGLEEIARETEFDKLKDDLESELGDTNSIGQEIVDAVDPDGDFTHQFDFEEGDFYNDHQDHDEDDDDEGEEVAGPPIAENFVETSKALASDAPAEASTDDPMDTDAKTDT